MSIANIRIFATEAPAPVEATAHDGSSLGHDAEELAHRSGTAGANKTDENAIARLVDKYNQTRAAMRSSPERTQEMEEIVAEMKMELAKSRSFDALALLDSADKGWRLAAYVFIQLFPTDRFLEPLGNSLKKFRSLRSSIRGGPPADNRPFGEYHGLLALEAVDRHIGAFTKEQSLLLKSVIEGVRPTGDSDRERVISRLRSRHPELNSPTA